MRSIVMCLLVSALWQRNEYRCHVISTNVEHMVILVFHAQFQYVNGTGLLHKGHSRVLVKTVKNTKRCGFGGNHDEWDGCLFFTI